MTENTFLKIVETDFNRTLFDEHLTDTPTLYINEVRHTGATDVESLLIAIKQADSEGHIQLPERSAECGALFNGYDVALIRPNVRPLEMPICHLERSSWPDYPFGQ